MIIYSIYYKSQKYRKCSVREIFILCEKKNRKNIDNTRIICYI